MPLGANIKAWWARQGKRQKRLLSHTGILLLVGVILALIALAQPFTSLQWTFSDMLFSPEPPSKNVVIAAIDDHTLHEINEGRLGEWPRSLHAQAIENLSLAGASVIGFDVLFADPSREPHEDDILAEAMTKASENGTSVVQPVAGIPPSSRQPEITYNRFEQPNKTLKPASYIGHANVLPDGDKKVRRMPLVAKDTTGQSYPALSLAVLHAHFFHESPPEDYPIEGGAIHFLTWDIPVDASGCMRINYTGNPGTFTHISYSNVIKGDFDPEIVKNNIVLVGVMGLTGETDYWVTPVSAEKMWGVEIHANTINTILRTRFLHETGGILTLLLTLLLITIAGLSLPRLKLKWGGLLAVGLVVVYLFSTFFTFDQGYILNIFLPPLAVVLVYAGSIICRITAERADKREVSDLFGKYVSPQVAGAMLKLSDAEQLRLGGELREATVLFCDIRGFTKLSAELSPGSIVNMLNQYFSVIIDRILANDGMINKFAGDNIMAVWNAPQSQPDHAQLAAKAAIESQKAIKELREREAELPKVQFGFGVNTGEAIAGNVGSEGRLEYTVIGDAVNLASRICGGAPGDKVWISSSTYEQAKETIQVKELEPQYFKGKEEPVIVYEVLE